MKKVMNFSRAFSLVETVLAIGVVSFALISILGYLVVGLTSSKTSLDETLVSGMARQIIGNLRQQQFASNTAIASVNSSSATTIQTAYFDISGTRLLGADGVTDLGLPEAIAKHAVYQCTVTAQGVMQSTKDPLGLGPVPRGSSAIPCMLDLNLTFTWPVEAKKTNSFSLRASLARYF